MEGIAYIINQYRQAAFLQGQATLIGDYKNGNRHSDIIVECYIKLRTIGVEAIEQLAVLLTDEDDNVISWAATHLLPYYEKRSIEALTSVSTKPGIIAFSAEIALNEWRKGTLNLEYLQYKKK